ncbi:hypothetical protein LQ953_08490 [Sphingomonas sp. IC-56]|uniref:hypothetical protein n=1 Tax=Sphingomonas sp. IC-56 TaxID=2898529 RepID=UPI001E6176C5|nr:hypothetical protein [Sphingomonas sp. IC-56]MCD2324046.1 hypothetical protein [Sphingomonas sp. IC-56]
MRFWFLGSALALGACSGGGAIPAARPAGHVPVPGGPVPASVSAIRGQTANALLAQFGKPLLDVSEGTARKLQFAGPICVLDAYLYPPHKGRGEPAVTYIDTRQRDGSPIDQASCLAALGAQRK